MPRPSDQFLQTYYELWRQGLPSAKLASKLKVKSTYLKKHVAVLHEFCRKRLAKETRSALAEDQPLKQLPLTDDWRVQLLESIENGLTLEETAGVLGVPLPTITQLWFSEDSTLKAEVEYARQRADVEVMAAVRRRAIGYTLDHEERVVETSYGGEPVDEEDADEHDGPTTKTRTIKTRKHIPAHPTSQKLWMVNRRGWVSDNPGTSPNLDDERTEYDVREALYKEED
jgi:hypothetical protein